MNRYCDRAGEHDHEGKDEIDYSGERGLRDWRAYYNCDVVALLEQISRTLSKGWSMLDLGTGSGILALAEIKFGAKRAVVIDSDPLAISVAKANARLNGINGIEFRVGDARKFSARGHIRHCLRKYLQRITA